MVRAAGWSPTPCAEYSWRVMNLAAFRTGQDLGDGALGFGFPDGGDQKIQPQQGDNGASRAEGDGSDAVAGGDQAQTDPEEMDQSRANNESGGVGGRMDETGHLRAVGVSVKQPKDGHSSHCGQDRDAPIGQNGQSQNQHGRSDPGFHREERHVAHPQHAADQDEEDEGRGDGPDGASAQLHTEKAHAEHGQKMIESEGRVGESAGESTFLHDRMSPGAVG